MMSAHLCKPSALYHLAEIMAFRSTKKVKRTLAVDYPQPLSVLLDRVTGESYSQFLEYLSVDFAEHHRGVYLTTVKFR